VEKIVEETVNKVKQLSVENLVLFPFVHLSDKMNDPDIAIKIMEHFDENSCS